MKEQIKQMTDIIWDMLPATNCYELSEALYNADYRKNNKMQGLRISPLGTRALPRKNNSQVFCTQCGSIQRFLLLSRQAENEGRCGMI